MARWFWKMGNSCSEHNLELALLFHVRRYTFVSRISQLLNRWPDPTPEYKDFKFSLFSGATFLDDFDFIDYRGGSLRGLGVNDQQATKLETDIYNSDCLLVLADSYHIANEHYYLATPRNELQVIQSFLREFLDRHPDKVLPIGVVLTKIDLVDPNQYSNFREHVFSLFSDLRNIVFVIHHGLNFRIFQFLLPDMGIAK